MIDVLKAALNLMAALAPFALVALAIYAFFTGQVDQIHNLLTLAFLIWIMQQFSEFRRELKRAKEPVK